jgi:superfamily II DNA/RNA helicase
MSDSLDDFFANLSNAPTGQRYCAQSTSDSDTDNRVKSFTLPEESDDSPASDSLTRNDPEFVLPPDHSSIDYPPWERDFVFPELRAALRSVDFSTASAYRSAADLTIENCDVPPLDKFDLFAQKNVGVAEFLSARGIERPTPVQAQAIPVAFSGRDVVVVSPTGTGKTLAFLLPLIFRVLERGESGGEPRALILSPTEPLAHQTATVFAELARPSKISFVEVTGGGLKFRQESALVRGAAVVIATPGRLIGFLESIDWRVCTFVVVDEADRILDAGFFGQLRSILDFIRPDRQTLFFGATLPPQIAELSRNSLCAPVRISVGRTGAPQAAIIHNFVAVAGLPEKREWLISHLQQFGSGRVLIFVKDRALCEALFEAVRGETGEVAFVHGELPQQAREAAFGKFRVGKTRFLVATEIAARGIDVPEIGTVVNIDAPERPQSYIHRVGRTGRAGRKGEAFTLLTPRDAPAAAELLQHFLLAGMEPPAELTEFVEAHPVESGRRGKKRFDFDF